jgi:hypothetical protein
MPQTRWALEILSEVGFSYDSSVFPFSGRRYGWPGFSLDICEVELPNGRSIIEVPMSTVRIFGKSIPACGGGYIRHFPYLYTHWAMKRVQRDRPAIVYMHPDDINTAPPPKKIRAALTKALWRSKLWHARRLHNRHTMESKLNRLLSEFRFTPIRDVIATTPVHKYVSLV